RSCDSPRHSLRCPRSARSSSRRPRRKSALRRRDRLSSTRTRESCPWDWSSSLALESGSIGQAGEEIAPPLGRHVEQTPQRIHKVTRAVVLAGVVGGVTHSTRPMMADDVAFLAEDVEYRLVPILALAHAALGAFRGAQPPRVAKIGGRITALAIGQEAKVPPAPLPGPGFEPRDRRLGYDIERHALSHMPRAAVDRVEQ